MKIKSQMKMKPQMKVDITNESLFKNKNEIYEQKFI